MYAISFCEDDYGDVYGVTDETAFDAFSDGFGAGANAYGAGKWRLYLLPRDEAEMVENEHIGEVMRAHEEIRRREEQSRLATNETTP